MKQKPRAVRDAMRPETEYEFDYSTAVRGKYYRRLLKEGANVLDPDVAKAFRDSETVNEALRSLLRMSEATRRLTARSGGRTRARSAAG